MDTLIDNTTEITMGKRDDKTGGDRGDDGKSVRSGGRSAGKIGSPVTPKQPKTPTSPSREKTDMQKILEKLEKLDKIDDSIAAQEIAVGQITENIGRITEKCNKNEGECRQIKEETADVKTQVKIQSTRLNEIEERIEFLERERRRNILVIDGLSENEGENTRDLVNKAFGDLGLNFDSGVCTSVYRRGKGRKQNEERGHAEERRPERPRPLIVTFQRQQEKAEVFRNLKNLKGKEEWEKVFFNDDLTETQAGEQRDLRALAAYAKNLGHESVVRAGQLVFNGRRYRYEEIFKLPEGINLLNAKTVHILEDRAVVFQSPHSPLSNLYPCNIVFRGERYLSAEGAWQFTRATVCGHFNEKPFKEKKIALNIRNTPEWEDKCEQIMLEILLAKFQQNRFCKETLLKTGDRKLFEGTGDRRWGCGIPISRAKLITFKNPGRNVLGALLEKVREDLKAK